MLTTVILTSYNAIKCKTKQDNRKGGMNNDGTILNMLDISVPRKHELKESS